MECILEKLINFHDGCFIFTSFAIVWCWKILTTFLTLFEQKAYAFSGLPILKTKKGVPRLNKYCKIKDGVGVGAGASVSAENETPSGSNLRGTIIFN